MDQQGRLWYVSYQPGWLRRLKLSRRLPGRDRLPALFPAPDCA